jgi:hypothetical protein
MLKGSSRLTEMESGLSHLGHGALSWRCFAIECSSWTKQCLALRAPSWNAGSPGSILWKLRLRPLPWGLDGTVAVLRAQPLASDRPVPVVEAYKDYEAQPMNINLPLQPNNYHYNRLNGIYYYATQSLDV